jgi:hypothetical protein
MSEQLITLHRRFERQSRPCARFVKECRHNLAAGGFDGAQILDIVCQRKDFLNLFIGQISDGNQMTHDCRIFR